MRYRNLLALLLLVAWLYGSILKHLFLEWVGPHHNQNFEHGILVPIFALFVLWQGRRQMAEIVPAPSWAGHPHRNRFEGQEVHQHGGVRQAVEGTTR